MATLPRPLLAALIAVLLFAAGWMAFLRSSTEGTSAPVVARAYQAAVSNTHNASTPAAAHASAPATHQARHTTRTATAHPPTTTRARHTASVTSRARHTPARRHAAPAFSQPTTASGRAQALSAALAADRVVAVLFYNPGGSVDQADVSLLESIPADGGRVLRLAVPISELAGFGAVTDHVAVTGSPTLVVIDGQHRARTIVGFADQLEVNQLVAGALAAR